MTDTAAQVVTLLSLLVEERTGLHHPARDQDLFVHKINDHADDQGFDSLLDYYYALRYDDPRGARFSALVDALVVGETFFFRELSGLQRIVEHVVARVTGRGRARVWSAACATGEEPVSLAVLLAEAGVLDRVELVATDLSERHLDRARRGLHSRRALRAAPDGHPPWLLPGQEGGVAVDPRIRDRITWRQLNLVDQVAVAALGTFDAILCRNVMIYFDDRTVRDLAATLARALDADGLLLVGASESLLRFGTVLQCVERQGTFLYRRSGGPP
jgi:chemotaxis protein methyltransferase CheR